MHVLSALEDFRVICWKNNRKWGKPHSGTSLDLFKVKHELSGGRFLLCDKASDDVKHNRGGLWIGGAGGGWKLCDKPFSHPLYFRGQQPSPLPEDAVWSERACAFSAAALSLQKFSPWTVCLQPAEHWLHCKNQRLEAERWNTRLKQELCLSQRRWRFLCSRLSSSGSDFNTAQRLKKKKHALVLLYPSLQCQTLRFLISPLDSGVGLSFTRLWEVGVRLWFVAL